MTVPQNILDRIIALLNMTQEKGCTIHEAATAAKTAQELIAKYRLSQAELMQTQAGVTQEEIVHKPEFFLYQSERRSAWREYLAGELCRLNHCRILLWTSYSILSKKQVSYRVIGGESDIQVCSYFFQYLSREIERLAEESKKNGLLSGKSQMHGFKVGAAQEVIRRMKQAQQEVRNGVAGAVQTAAMVKVDARGEEVETWMKKNLNTTKSPACQSQISAHGYQQGTLAGKGIALNQGVGEGKTSKALGS